MEYFENSFDFADKNGDDFLKTVACGNIGVVYSLKGDINKAIQLYCSGLKFFQTHNYPISVAQACTNIALAHSYLKDYGKAYEFIQEAINIYKDAEATYNVARAYTTYAII